MFTAALAAASGAYRTLPENVMRVNYSGRRADCSALPHGSPSHAHNAASARKLARKNLSSSGRTATTISRDRNVQPIVGRLRHRPYADRHCCGCLMSAPLAACRTHETNGQILKQMESTSGFSATKFLLLAISILLFHLSVKSDRLLGPRIRIDRPF